MIEYALKHVDHERTFHMHSLHDAVEAWKMQDNRDHWQIVERHTSKWSQVE